MVVMDSYSNPDDLGLTSAYRIRFFLFIQKIAKSLNEPETFHV
jgi:hypothetical protein